MKKLDSYLEELEKAMCLNRQHRPQNSNGLSHTSSNNLLLSSLYHPKGFGENNQCHSAGRPTFLPHLNNSKTPMLGALIKS